MLVLRCTRKLLDRLPGETGSAIAASTGVLGDWYGTILLLRPAQLILLVNERSRLPVVLAARPIATLFDRIPDAVADSLAGLGINAEAIERERVAMRDIRSAPTQGRSVLGAMNEFILQIQWQREDGPLPDLRTLSRDLAEVLIGVKGRDYIHPADETRLLFGEQPIAPGYRRTPLGHDE